MAKIYNLTGQKFGLLTVTRKSSVKRGTNNVTWWNCRCDCGGRALVRTARLVAKTQPTRSCGCLRITHKDNNMSRGANHYKARKNIKMHGEWVPSTSGWAVRASRIKSSAQRHDIPFGFKSVSEFALYIKEIQPEKCPVFGIPLQVGTKYSHRGSPSVDRIIPEKGYVRGNLQVISYLANTMKQDASLDQLEMFAKWSLKIVKSARKGEQK